MRKDTTFEELGREAISDELTELLRGGARELISRAVEAELEVFLERYESLCLLNGRKAVVRNGFLPEREIQTGIGGVAVRVPKVRDRSGGGIRFASALLPPCLKRTKSVEEMLPWLYLKGISTGDYEGALHALPGNGAPGLSADTVSRLKKKWQGEYDFWRRRDLSGKR